ncbi:MAG: hypothetical protein WKF96_25675 [Solirubrobacteraceae bacterium]
MTPDDDENGSDQADDEVPPPIIIKIEDSADLISPYDSLDGALLVRDDAVAVARIQADSISAEDGDGVLVGRAIADLSYIIGELAKRSGDVRVREVIFHNTVDSVDLGFIGTPVEETLLGRASVARPGAQRLLNALASTDLESLIKALAGVDESLVVRLEELLKLLFGYAAIIDMQTPGSKPTRIVPARSHALYRALREPTEQPPRGFVAAGRLVGAIADTRDFKLRLDDVWKGRRVLEGKFQDGLEVQMETLWNKEVRASITYEELRRGVRPPDYRFHLDDLQAAPSLPFGE